MWSTTLKNLDNQSLINAFTEYEAELGKLPKTLYTDCGPKIFGSNLTSSLNLHHCKLCSAPSGFQNQNGPVERVWRELVKMASAYLSNMQCPKTFWNWAIIHTSCKMNYMPAKVATVLTSPFKLVHSTPSAWRIPFCLLSTGYFRYE